MKSNLPPPNYTQVPNAILDSIPRLKGAELSVIMVICRATFGWHKAVTKMSIEKLKELTGLSRPSVIKAIQTLVDCGWVQKQKNGQSFGYAIVLETEESNSLTGKESLPAPVKKVNRSGKESLPVEVKKVNRLSDASDCGCNDFGNPKETEKNIERKDPIGAPKAAPWPDDPRPAHLFHVEQNGSPSGSEDSSTPEPSASSDEHDCVGQKSSKRVPSESGMAHAELIAMWCDGYRIRFGVQYAVCGGKDGRAVKDILLRTKLAPERIVAIAKAAWERVGEFPFDSATSIAAFNGRFNEIQAKLAVTKQNNGNGRNYHKADYDRNAGTSNAAAAGEYAGIGVVR